MKVEKNPRKPLIVFYLVVIGILLLSNMLILPTIM